MTILHRLVWPLIAAVMLFSVTARAQETCSATPDNYRDLEFGDVRFAIEEGCKRTLTQEEQFFVAGIAQTLLTRCKLPRDRDGRAAVERFIKAVALALSLQKPDGPLRNTITTQAESAAAFAAGTSMMEDIECNGPEAALLARGIAAYLKRVSASSRFVVGCTAFYAKQYTEKQCQCIAEAIRPVWPDIDQRYFDRQLIKESINDSPFIALPLMISCGVDNY